MGTLEVERGETEVNYDVEIAEAKIERALVRYAYVIYKVLPQTEEEYQSIELTTTR